MAHRPRGRKEGKPPGQVDPTGSSPGQIWRDWITIWQSELNALGTDQEVRNAWTKLIEMWAAGARTAGALLPDGAQGYARPESPAGAAPASAPPDARECERQRRELERLARRVEELERRLGDGSGSDAGLRHHKRGDSTPRDQ
jgi:hypothetical protein